MQRRVRVALCEGRDDLAAIRALVRAEGCPPLVEATAPREQWELRFESRDLVLRVIRAENAKSGLADRAVRLATASERPEIIAVCFDPDEDPAAREFRFFIDSFERVARGRTGPLSLHERRHV